MSAAIDSAKNRVGRLQGTVIRLEQVSLSWFCRIWCIAHELDLAIQSLMKECLHERFYQPVISLISYLRRHLTILNAMGGKSPTVCSRRWSSVGAATKWLLSHRMTVHSYV